MPLSEFYSQKLHPLVFQIRNTFLNSCNTPWYLNFPGRIYNKKILRNNWLLPITSASRIYVAELKFPSYWFLTSRFVGDQKQKNKITLPIQHILHIFRCPECNNALKDRHQEGMVFELIGSGMRPIKSMFATSNTPP